MDSRVMIVALSAIFIVNGHPVPDGQSKSVVSGVFIPADTFKNLQADTNKNRGQVNGPFSDRIQNNGQASNQGLPMDSNLKINPSSQNLQQQSSQQPMPSYPQSNQQQIIVNRPSQSSQQPVFINQKSQPMLIGQQNPQILGNQQPNQQSVLVQSQSPVLFNQQPGQLLVQTPNQQQFYVAQNPHQIYVSQQPNQPIIIHQQPNQGQPMMVTQPGQQQGIIITQQPNQQLMYVNQPSNQMLIKDGGTQQQIMVSQPGQRPTFLISGPNQSITPNGQVSQAVVTVAQPAMNNGNQAVFVPKPNQNNVLYYPLNNQGMANGNTFLIPVQQ